MTASATGTCTPFPIHHDPIGKLIDTLPDTSAGEGARKRQRDVFVIQSGNLLSNLNSAAATGTAADSSTAEGKKLKKIDGNIHYSKLKKMTGPIVNKSTKPPCGVGKRPQMKYNPDIPMAKEEVSRWRKEERRKRNRESAAASRQRQRDRITELELEVDSWKSKFESVMEKIIQLDGLKVTKNIPPNEDGGVNIKTEQIIDEVIAPINTSIAPMPCFSLNSPVPSSVSVDITSNVTPCGGVNQVFEEEGEPQQSNMISRPAVKITDVAPPLPLLPEFLLPPEPCMSLSTRQITLQPTESSLFLHSSLGERKLPPRLLTDEEKSETELGEFLLDAVDWL